MIKYRWPACRQDHRKKIGVIRFATKVSSLIALDEAAVRPEGVASTGSLADLPSRSTTRVFIVYRHYIKRSPPLLASCHLPPLRPFSPPPLTVLFFVIVAILWMDNDILVFLKPNLDVFRESSFNG